MTASCENFFTILLCDISFTFFFTEGKGYHVDDLKPLVNTKFFENFEVKYNAEESVSLEQVINYTFWLFLIRVKVKTEPYGISRGI